MLDAQALRTKLEHVRHLADLSLAKGPAVSGVGIVDLSTVGASIGLLALGGVVPGDYLQVSGGPHGSCVAVVGAGVRGQCANDLAERAIQRRRGGQRAGLPSKSAVLRPRRRFTSTAYAAVNIIAQRIFICMGRLEKAPACDMVR